MRERESGRDDGNGSILVYSRAVLFVTQPAGFASEVGFFNSFIHPYVTPQFTNDTAKRVAQDGFRAE